MSEYKPWAPEADAPAPKKTAAIEREDFALPPGAARAPAAKQALRGYRLSAALLLGVAGFLAFIGLVGALLANAIIVAEEVSHEGYVEPEAYTLRTMSAWTIVAGLAIAAPGIGLIYDQPWAKTAAKIASAIACLPPFTLWGVLSLVHLERK